MIEINLTFFGNVWVKENGNFPEFSKIQDIKDFASKMNYRFGYEQTARGDGCGNVMFSKVLDCGYVANGVAELFTWKLRA
jgi:hypothetical protein